MSDDRLKPPPNTQPWCSVHAERISALMHEVFGNGKPGLTERMRKVEQQMEVNTAKQDTVIKLVKWQIGILLTITGIATTLIVGVGVL